MAAIQEIKSEILNLGHDEKYYLGVTSSSIQSFRPSIPNWESLVHWNGQPAHPRIVKSPSCNALSLFKVLLHETRDDSRCINHKNGRDQLQDEGDIIFIAIYDFDSGFTTDCMIELTNTQQLEHVIMKMGPDRRYYIGYTDQGVGPYLYHTEPKSQGWEEKAHYLGNPVKVRTYYVKLNRGDDTEHALIQRYRNKSNCLNEAVGEKKTSGIVYLVEYNYRG